MESDQEIRSHATAVAATLLAPTQPDPIGFILSSEIIATYIKSGREAALDLYYRNFPAGQEGEPVHPVESSISVETETSQEEGEPSIISTQSEEKAPPLLAGRDEEEGGEIIPLAARAPVSDKQLAARRAIEKQRRQRADGIFKQARVAKAASHKEKLLEQTIQAGLDDFVLTIDGKPSKLGDYIRSIQES